jgi:hypothetical protein
MKCNPATFSQRCAFVLSSQLGRRGFSGRTPPAAVFRWGLNLYEHCYEF